MKPYIRILAAATAIGAVGAGLAVAQDGPRRGPGALDFAAIDADGDGSLSRTELTERAASRIAVIDADGDGQVTRAEIVGSMPPRDGLRHVFSVDPAEEMADRLLATLGATAAGAAPLPALSERQVNMLLTFLDDDRDDALSAAEAADAEPGGRRHGRRWHGDGGPNL